MSHTVSRRSTLTSSGVGLTSMILTLGLLTSPAKAFDLQGVQVRGFGTVGYSSSSTNWPMQYWGVDGDRADFTQLSRFGANLHSDISHNWELNAEVEARGDTNQFTPFLNWGFVSYRASNAVAVRAGRLVAPFWLYSQQIDVGYSYPWTVLPAEVYSLVGLFKAVDGVSVLAKTKLGAGFVGFEIIGGETTSTYTPLAAPFAAQSNEVTIRANDWISTELNYEWENWLTGRVSYTQTHAQGQVTTTAQTSSINGIVESQGVNPLDISMTRLFSVGFKMDMHHLFASGEWVRRTIEGTYAPSASAYYIMVGADLGLWSPYYSYSAVYDLKGVSYAHPDPTVSLSTLEINGHTHTVGLNYHLAESITLKGSYGLAQMNFSDATKDLNFSVVQSTLEFVF